MKKNFLFFFVTFLSCQLCGQFIKKDSQYIGFTPFVLGTPLSTFIANELKGGKYSKDNHEFTLYGYGGGPVEIAGIRFNSTILTFNDSNMLAGFSLLKFYRKNADPGYEKKAKKDYAVIIDYTMEQMAHKGEKRTYYNSHLAIDKGQEWSGHSFFLRIKKNSSAYQSSVEFSFSYPGVQ
ncbi:MAG: hypothetical protein ABI688_11515 [Bacteroidota bacterium]